MLPSLKNISTVSKLKRRRMKPFQCSFCDYNCSKECNLAEHIISVHEGKPNEGKKQFECPTCHYNYSHKGNLTKHIKSVHEGKKPFKTERLGAFTLFWNTFLDPPFF